MSHPHAVANTTPSIPPSHATQAQVLRSRAYSPIPHTSSLPTRAGQAMAQGSQGSQTQTQTNTDTRETAAVLRLRGAHEPGTRRAVQWAEDVVDNEGLGRKSSKGMSGSVPPGGAGAGIAMKQERMALPLRNSADTRDDVVCCIYHAPKAVGESSSEDDSSSGSESDGSDSGVDDGAARMVGAGGGRGKRRRRRRSGHRLEHGDDCGDKVVKGRRRPSPNAYEKMPKSSTKRDVKK